MRLCSQEWSSCFRSVADTRLLALSGSRVTSRVEGGGPGGGEEGAYSPLGLAHTISTWPTGGWSVAGSCPGGTPAGGPRPTRSCAPPSWG